MTYKEFLERKILNVPSWRRQFELMQINKQKYMNEYVASFLTSVQYTEYKWTSVRPSLKVTDETTIGEIWKWIKDTHRAQHEMEFTVRKLENILEQQESISQTG